MAAWGLDDASNTTSASSVWNDLAAVHVLHNALAAGRGGSVAEWLACWTQAQKGPGSNRSRDAVG